MSRLSLPLESDRAGGPRRGPGLATGLIDTFGRRHSNLRISVTDRCNLRCTYCMPEDVTFLPREELLRFEEIAAIAGVATSLGIDKIRLTGGEPLLRRDLPTLVGMLAPLPGLRDLSLTTNGILLADQAERLFSAGLRRLNVSLDTLDADRFRILARRDGLDRVIHGLMTAKQIGFRIKVNAVALRGFIEEDIVPLARFCRQHDFELRFIESMPIGAEPWQREQCVSATELLTILSREVAPLTLADDADPQAPAQEFVYADTAQRMGVIASVTRPFCHQCNRLRLTAEGKLRNCLFALEEIDVRPFVRGAAIDESGLREAFERSVASKWEGHAFNAAHFVKPTRTMHAIGG